jgi:hypothetical protein
MTKCLKGIDASCFGNFGPILFGPQKKCQQMQQVERWQAVIESCKTWREANLSHLYCVTLIL